MPLSENRGGVMINFEFARTNDVADSVRQTGAEPTTKFTAGRTNLLDPMREEVEHPNRPIDIMRSGRARAGDVGQSPLGPSQISGDLVRTVRITQVSWRQQQARAVGSN
jgi:hypothetical protein